MKKVGIIGGLTSESSAMFYLDISREANRYLGRHHNLEVLMISISPEEVFIAVQNGQWDKVARMLTKVAQKLEIMGADFIVMPCNTVHQVADHIQMNISVPLLNIIDCVGAYCIQKNIYKVGLLGTKFTMENTFYSERLLRHYDVPLINSLGVQSSCAVQHAVSYTSTWSVLNKVA